MAEGRIFQSSKRAGKIEEMFRQIADQPFPEPIREIYCGQAFIDLGIRLGRVVTDSEGRYWTELWPGIELKPLRLLKTDSYDHGYDNYLKQKLAEVGIRVIDAE